ncbi:MAG: Oxygen-dependent choline dehydrogenase [Chroococcidiopsis cubana SAG 39.79]|uniref:GMC oxidoreductase n=1 Tax=Chroococcidiopsis cubana SAG 39.79 TaxID=388085 RepID=A0AB37UDN4_9CYAN|nr:GMC family oxidoreductase [Chroococcidiopsis cubana]MDZ4871541.1 Oxygen-dependent choline dehydrogenase [Chroococcidiopsis cubana SAG 39.79]PSB61982.1 GMC family oxidoreductase [Chroococcidiopsis cubana CCALA 043]RUT05823.1 GMC oxidoreductase [Chroococcidiopsis cubana SAG 39.79]
MIIDAHSLPPNISLEVEVCIVGGGPAGIALAREFANQKFQVCLLESGGCKLEQDIQSLADGKVIGDPYPNLSESRCRQFGGTAHTWGSPIGYKQSGFRCFPLDKIDFEQREWLPYSGWPFTRTDLDPFYQRAHQVCQLGAFTYNVEDWEKTSARRLPLKSDRFMTTISQYSSRSIFTQDYQQQIGQASNITTLLHATVVEIETDEVAKSVTRLRVACSQDKQFWISAKVFVLATGGIENARLLLLSNRVQKTGLGNQNELVGRFFMERRYISCGMLVPYNRHFFDRTSLYDIRNVRGVPVMAQVTLSENLMHREQLLNFGAQLLPRPQFHQREAIRSLKTLLTSVYHAKLPKNTLEHLGNAIRDSNYIAAATFWAAIRQLPGLQRSYWSYLNFEKRRFSMLEVISQFEQAPDPNNRVVLSHERDRLNQNKAEVHWQLNNIDLYTIERVKKIWAEEVARAGIGKFQPAEVLKAKELALYRPSCHHMGTTRMHDNPRQGVVNANCRVHGIENLYIAGSSVFPTSGYANPTLTIIALAIRLADHIKAILNVSPEIISTGLEVDNLVSNNR